MTLPMPDLSIIIPTFRREALLLEALQSALAVPGLALEVLVIDDSPEGGAQAVVQALGDPRVQYLQQRPPSGGRPAVLRNLGAQIARGRLLYFLDDDDHALPQALAEACRRLDGAGCGVAIGLPRPFGAVPTRVEEERAYFEAAARFLARHGSRWAVTARLLFGHALVVCSTFVLRRDAFLATGGFLTDMAVYEDIDLCMRVVRHAGFLNLGQAIVARRVGGPSLISQSTQAQMLEAYRLSQAHYRRQRGPMEFLALKVLNRCMA